MILTSVLFALGLIVNTFTSTLNAGQEVSITWSITGSVPETVDFQLLDGTVDFNVAADVANILTGANSNALSFVWTVPQVPSGSKYFIRVGRDGDYVYSGAFAISGTEKVSPPITSAPTSVKSTAPSTPSSTPTLTDTKNDNKDPNRRYVSSNSANSAKITAAISYFLFSLLL